MNGCLTLLQAADLAGVARSTLYYWIDLLGVTTQKEQGDKRLWVRQGDAERIARVRCERKKKRRTAD